MSNWCKDGFSISTHKDRLDLPMIYEFLTNAYWGQGRSHELIKRAIDHSICFGVYEDASQRQVGFARVISDCATLSYLSDVFICPSHQKLGLGKWLVETIINYDAIRRTPIVLATRDQQPFYKQLGFKIHANPERVMIRVG